VGALRKVEIPDHRHDPRRPAVSQFWKYEPAELLKQLVYSRDVPPCRYC
jgi:hypothetical protein